MLMEIKKGWIIAVAIILVIVVSVYVSGKDKGSEDKMLSGKHKIVMEIKDYGEIKLTLDADIAPITVTNFINLVKDGFYDGLTFHRIIDGFMIQGGDPDGDGTGGNGNLIKGEFSSNGYTANTISHVRGVISMARSQHPDSASCQFFIVQSDSTYLDGNYAAFGNVTEGMDVVDKISKELNSSLESGYVEKDKQPVITKIYVVE